MLMFYAKELKQHISLILLLGTITAYNISPPILTFMDEGAIALKAYILRHDAPESIKQQYPRF